MERKIHKKRFAFFQETLQEVVERKGYRYSLQMNWRKKKNMKSVF